MANTTRINLTVDHDLRASIQRYADNFGWSLSGAIVHLLQVSEPEINKLSSEAEKAAKKAKMTQEEFAAKISKQAIAQQADFVNDQNAVKPRPKRK